MASLFGELPKGVASVQPFQLSIPDSSLEELQTLLNLSKIGPTTWESSQDDRRYGVTAAWLASAKEHWVKGFDWRFCESHINSFSQFKAAINEDGEQYDIHFTALFSKKANAVPIIALHGWPGSFLEFLPIMSIIKERYTPETLPYHFVVPSLPGYTLSSGPGPTKPLTMPKATRILDQLMTHNLDFHTGYIASGGDVGSSVARNLAATCSGCKAMHLNFCNMGQPATIPLSALSPQELAFVQRGQEFRGMGSAYAMEHGTRPSTIGLALTTSPLALLAWIGEKFLAWSDEDPSLDTIIESVSLYWFTETMARCLYPYRQTWDKERPGHDGPELHVRKPFGYSVFPKELIAVPRSWAATTGDLSWFRQHEAGGHFAALEKPGEMLEDIEDFARHVRERGVTFGS